MCGHYRRRLLLPALTAFSTVQNNVSLSFARGEFSSLVTAFSQAGFAVQQPLPGVLQICGSGTAERMRLLISVGVHGDETAPIEIMALLLDELSKTPQSLAVDLMVVVGNIDAIKEAKRFVDVDLNRLFTPNRTNFNDAQEARRADQLMAVAAQFFSGHDHKWHLDLHTAIRASYYSTFAIVPGTYNDSFVHWLGTAGIEAVVLNPDASVTFSSYTCQHLGAVSCTAELGRIGELGKNDLSQFAKTTEALSGLLAGAANASIHQKPLVFRVSQELIKRSDAFQLTFDGSTQNFTQFAPHTVIATDGDTSYSVGDEIEYVLFPNPNVRIGLRAGLMVVKVE
jgi:succinylglutamate desuccinylase